MELKHGASDLEYQWVMCSEQQKHSIHCPLGGAPWVYPARVTLLCLAHLPELRIVPAPRSPARLPLPKLSV